MKRYSHNFAVFNSHINDASNKADAEFIAQFGQEAFDEHIKPHHENGIMGIFNESPSLHTMSWVVLCTCYVNQPTS